MVKNYSVVERRAIALASCDNPLPTDEQIKAEIKSGLWNAYSGTREERRKKEFKVIFVSGAFRAPTQWGITQNVRRAEEISLQLWQQGYAVICPHTMTQHFQGEMPDAVWLDGCLELIRRCDAIFMMKGWAMSEGSEEEHQLAKSLGLEIIYEADWIPYNG